MREIIKDFSIGYGLDGGGYEFESCKVAGHKFLYLDSGLDYLPIGQNQCDFVVCSPGGRESLPEFLWQTDTVPFYDSLGTLAGYENIVEVFRRCDSGLVYESDRECDCNGYYDEDHVWNYSGNFSDAPHPKCERCEGDGYVLSPGFTYSTYERMDGEDLYFHPFAWLAILSDCAHFSQSHDDQKSDTEYPILVDRQKEA